MKLILLSLIGLIACGANAQVNMQSGAAEQSFPLINYTDSKAGLNLGVGIAYSSGNGLMVNEIATNVGTGWSLQAGGSIMRVQNGQPDDQPAYGNLTKNTAYRRVNDEAGLKSLASSYYAGYMYNNTNDKKSCNEGVQYFPLFEEENIVYKRFTYVNADLEQDKFVFNFAGHAGSFIISKVNNDWKATSIGDSRLKISFTQTDMTSNGIRTTINKFIIEAEDGVKYTFSDLGLSRICQYKLSEFDKTKNEWVPIKGNPSEFDKITNKWLPIKKNPSEEPMAVKRFYAYPLEDDMRPFIVNSWFLSEIENTNNGQKINFHYDEVQNDIITAKTVSHIWNLNKSSVFTKKYVHVGSATVNIFGIGTAANGANWYWYFHDQSNAMEVAKDITKLNKLKTTNTSLVYSRSISTSKRLSRIDLPNNGNVIFAYDNIPRADLDNEGALYSISYFIGSQFIRGYKFDYGYLYKNTIKPYLNTFTTYEKKLARLCLTSVQKLGNPFDNATEPPYRFTYITSSSRDADDIVPGRNFITQDHWGYYNGSISGIPLDQDHDFLTDEKSGYFKAVLYGNRALKTLRAQNGLLRSVIYPTGGSITYTYQQNKTFNKATGIDEFTGGVSVAKTVINDGENSSKDIIIEYNYLAKDGHSSRWGYEEPQNYDLSHNYYVLAAGHKSFKHPGIEYPEMASNTDMSKMLGKAILTSLFSAGFQMIAEAALNIMVPYLGTAISVAMAVYAVINILFEKFSATKQNTYTYTLSNQNHINSNPIGERYARIEIKSNSPSGYNGKTVYEFTSDQDYSLLRPKLEWPYIQAPRMITWLYGLPKSVVVYNKDNQIVNESYNGYSLYKSLAGAIKINKNIAYNINDDNCNCSSRKSESVRWENWDKYAGYINYDKNELLPRPYQHITGRIDQSLSLQRSYNSSGQLYNENITTVLTDPSSLIQKATTIQKDENTKLTTISYFPKDYNISGAIAKLKERNAIHTPIATETWQFKEVTDITGTHEERSLLDARVTEFELRAIGGRDQVLPVRIYALRTNAPIPVSVIGEERVKSPRNSLFLFDDYADHYKLETEMIYDDEGNLVQTISDGNVTSFINDYSARYVVASVANADYRDIAYTSFESNGNGGWNYNSAAILSTTQLTGNKAFQLSASNNITKTNIRTGTGMPQKYTITYWANTTNSSSVLINGQLGSLLYTTPYGWTLYKKEINATSTVTISGTAIIDELRLFPSEALMSTVAYMEGIGKITESDANNRLIFYEYDGLGRLKLIRDQNRNIIKTYEYNYKKQ